MKRIILSLLVLSLIISSGCVNRGDVIELDGTEVREYQGERLSSVNDFRENSIRGPQEVDVKDYRLMVFGLVDRPMNYTYGQVLDFQGYSKVVTLFCVEGWNAKILWEGVLVSDIVGASEPVEGADTVIFHAADGYASSLPLGYLGDNRIIMAYRMNGVTLPEERGFPFQLVAEDKWGYKWVKWITGIELSDDPSYEGYWESRGYSNEGDVDRPFFG